MGCNSYVKYQIYDKSEILNNYSIAARQEYFSQNTIKGLKFCFVPKTTDFYTIYGGHIDTTNSTTYQGPEAKLV